MEPKWQDCVQSGLEAAILDLCHEPVFRREKWNSKRALADEVAGHARVEAEVDDIVAALDRLRKMKLVRRDTSYGKHEHVTTESGLRALLAWIGIGQIGPVKHISIRAPILHDIETRVLARFASAFDPRGSRSRLPFRAPRGRTAQDRCAQLFRAWDEGERGWMILAFLQEHLEQERWIDRAADRRIAIFEMNKALHFMQLALRWETALLASAAEAPDETLAVKYALQAQEVTAPPLVAVPSVPLPEEIPWHVDEVTFTKDFVMPLAKGLGLRSVSYRGGPSENGKDVVGKYADPLLLDRWVAIQVKMELPADAKAAAVRGLQQQIDEAFGLPFEEPSARMRQHVHEVWVVVAKPLTSKVRQAIVDGIEEPARKANVRFIEHEALAEHHARLRKRP